ncbi:MAG: rRNA maturation RNase YbeY [Nitrospirae bacterium]|nr:rRNA maturation RNase YbeY [Nitrospirota bacterium]
MVIRIRNRQRSKSLNLRKVRKDLAVAGTVIGLAGVELSISFIGSARMKSLNARYRGIPKDTDVLSFPMDTGPIHSASARPVPSAPCRLPVLLGDIVISVPRAARQAKAYGVAFHEEIRRLLVHGLLHLAGYDHEAGKYQKARMERKEKELLNALAEMD